MFISSYTIVYFFVHNFFFLNVYISVNKKGPYLSSIQVRTQLGEWRRSSKMCTSAYRGEEVEKLVIRYVRPKWIAPNKYFCALARPSTLEHHREQGKCRRFLPS